METSYLKKGDSASFFQMHLAKVGIYEEILNLIMLIKNTLTLVHNTCC